MNSDISSLTQIAKLLIPRIKKIEKFSLGSCDITKPLCLNNWPEPKDVYLEECFPKLYHWYICGEGGMHVFLSEGDFIITFQDDSKERLPKVLIEFLNERK